MVNERKKKTSEENNTQQPVKEKKKRLTPTNTSLLPPCKVCLEPAAGFHYGVNTCEACKGFFRRTLVRQGDYECVNHDEKCDIVQDHRNNKKRMCPRCRHLKCIAVGMSPEAIKTGRYTHAKRTQDVMEYQQSLGMAVIDDHPSPEITSDSSVVSTVNSPSSHCSLEKAPSKSVVSTLISPSSTSTASSPLSPAKSESFKMSASCYSVKASSTGTVLSPSMSQISDNDLSASASSPLEVPTTAFASLEVPGLTPQCFGVPHSMDSLEVIRSGVPSATPSPFNSEDLCSSNFTLVDSIVHQEVSGEFRHSEECPTPASLSSHPSVCSPVSDSQISSASVPIAASIQESSDNLSEHDCKQLIQHVCESHKQIMMSVYHNYTAEEMLEKQQQCFDNCKARSETFGPMGSLSEEEYQEIYQTTGIDVDDRQTFVTILSKLLDCAIRRSIAWMKTIPGFSELPIDDQIALIKENRYEMSLLTQTTCYNSKLKVMILPSGRCFCEHDIEKIMGKERLQIRHQCLTAVQDLGLTYEERILFKCVMLFTVGNADIKKTHQASMLQWKMTQCLLWLLKENKHPNPNQLFAKMISVFIRLKSFAFDFFEWFKSKPFIHYAQFMKNELIVEWFSTS